MEKHHDHHHHRSHEAASDTFPTDPAGLPESAPSEVVDLDDGGELKLRIAPVAKRIGEATVRMLAYNGSVPGPTLISVIGTPTNSDRYWRYSRAAAGRSDSSRHSVMSSVQPRSSSYSPTEWCSTVWW
jgi:hypothetical protein